MIFLSKGIGGGEAGEEMGESTDLTADFVVRVVVLPVAWASVKAKYEEEREMRESGEDWTGWGGSWLE